MWTDEAQDTSEERELGWPITLRSVELLLRTSGLDLFERLVLELRAAKVSGDEAIARLTGLDVDFVGAIHVELTSRGMLRDEPHDDPVTSAGRKALDDDDLQRIPGWMAYDGLTGQPLPGFWTRPPKRNNHLNRLGEYAKGLAPPTGQDMNLLEAYRDWALYTRDARPRAPNDEIVAVRSLSEGERRWLPVRLRASRDGHPTVHAEGLPDDLLNDRLERARPSAWVQFDEDLRGERERLERARQDKGLQAKATALRVKRYGADVPDELSGLLDSITLARMLTDRFAHQDEAALTGYRKISEAIAKMLSPARLDKPALDRREQLPKKPPEMISTLQPRLEALADPQLLLPSPDTLKGWLSSIRGFKGRPGQGVGLMCWPFWCAALDPNEPSAQRLRAAASRCPTLWRELNLLRSHGNPGAHYNEQTKTVDPAEYTLLDRTVRALLEALTGASSVIEPERAAEVEARPQAKPRWSALHQARVKAKALPSPEVAEALWRAMAEWDQRWPITEGFSLDAWANELPTDSSRCLKDICRALESLSPPDDDGVGYEPPEWVKHALVEAVTAAQRQQRKAHLAPLSSLLRAAAGDPETQAALKRSLEGDRGDPWILLGQVHEIAAGAVRSPQISASQWSQQRERAFDALEALHKRLDEESPDAPQVQVQV